MNISLLTPLLATAVTWIRVPKRSLGIVEVLLVSLQIAALCAVAALVLGTALGVTIILLRRRQPPLHNRLELLNIRR